MAFDTDKQADTVSNRQQYRRFLSVYVSVCYHLADMLSRPPVKMFKKEVPVQFCWLWKHDVLIGV